jgi:hypothetical protein
MAAGELGVIGFQAMDLGGILTSLPQILGIVQIVMYVFLSLFFGAIAIIGYRGFLSWWIKIPLRFGIGFLCLIVGISIAGFIPVPSPLDLFQTDAMIGGIVTSIIFLIAINIFSYRLPWLIGGFENRIKHFQNKISKLKSGGNLVFMTPMRIIGLAIFFGFLIYGLVTFPGFPSLTEDVFSMVGLDIDTNSMTPGCQAMMTSVYANIDTLIGGGTLPTPYTNPTLETVMEQGCGESITILTRYDLDTSVVVGVTASGTLCLGTETEYCTSMDLSSLGV